MTYWIAGAAAVGALVDRENPLRGAAIGAGTAFTGGAALGALGGGAAAAGGAGAAGAGTTAAGTAGLLGSAGTAGAGAGVTGATAAGAAEGAGLLGTAAADTAALETGVNSMGYLAPEMTGTVAEQAAAPVVNMSQPAGFMDKANYAMGNTFSQGGKMAGLLDTANKVSKPAMVGMQAAQLMKPNEQQAPAPQILPPTASPTLQQLAGQNDQMNMQRMQEEQRRRELQRQRIAMMGGR